MTATVSPIRAPFTVLIDTAESSPWTFHGLKADADKCDAPLAVPYRFSNLGRHPNSLGDYSIDGLVGQVAIERKSMEDCQSTILGWETDYQKNKNIVGRRDRFKRELANLHQLRAAIVIVEAPRLTCCTYMPGCDGCDYIDEFGICNETYGDRSVAENRKTFNRTIASWRTIPRPGEPDLRVDWEWCLNRRDAEQFAFRWLEKFWQHLSKAERKAWLERTGAA